jgi:hypothetical protein
MSPRVISTSADGTQNTAFDYLRATPKTPFVIGKMLQAGNDTVYGYSGMVNFDATLQPQYPLINFTLDRDAMIKVIFNCDWNVIEATGSDVGVLIAIDGLNVIRTQWEVRAGAVNKVPAATSPWIAEYFVPAERNCSLAVLNPDASADLLQANVHLVGRLR